MKQAHYWERQEDRWHQQYLLAERLCDTLEQRIYELEQTIIQADKYQMSDELRQHLKKALGDNHAG
jgi:hypothetical protein